MRFVPASVSGSMRRSIKNVLALALAAAVLTAPSVASAAKGAAIVIDATTGKTLYSSEADEARYPASLTKMMTLYMVFEAMNAGRINKNTAVPYSRHAASRPPTKLGVRAGGSVSVETAILSLVTRSANDSAAALGELLGGSEENFARLMTTKARKLGMRSTTFRNASGLPDPRQVTTARDMAVLGMSLREHFPKQYSYFSVRSFKHGRSRINNHNKLLGRVKGVDGIKTGYTRASGFNLVSSVKDGNRMLVAVVMGGKSGRSRDAQMAKLIAAYMPKTKGRGDNPLIAERGMGTLETVAEVKEIAPRAPIVAALVPTPRPSRKLAAQAKVESIIAEAPQEPKIETDPVSTASIKTPSEAHSGWVIQVGSVASEKDARALLDKTSGKASGLLASAEPFTEQFVKGGTTYIRARFGGFSSQSQATSTCAALKKRSISCYAVQQ